MCGRRNGVGERGVRWWNRSLLWGCEQESLFFVELGLFGGRWVMGVELQ